MKPKRIQRKRTKGWKMPANTVYVGRPSAWGNPFRIGGRFVIGGPGLKNVGTFRVSYYELITNKNDTRFTLIDGPEIAAEFYANYLKANPLKDIAKLKGKNLACWCPLDQPCHADLLLELANK